MRNVIALTISLLLPLALASPNIFSPFFSAEANEAFAQSNDTSENTELRKRQDGCPDGYNSCIALGAAGLCCRDNTLCATDQLGQVACCPIGAACTGRIDGIASGTALPSTSSLTGFVFPTTGTTATVNVVSVASSQGGFIVADSTTVAQPSGAVLTRSTVPNQYYPFAYIPTTYINAAACSQAYTGCQTDLASCTAALTGGPGGLTGAAAPSVTVTVNPSSATSICLSLSSLACSGLQVEACQAFGTANPAAPTIQGNGGCHLAGVEKVYIVEIMMLMTFMGRTLV